MHKKCSNYGKWRIIHFWENIMKLTKKEQVRIKILKQLSKTDRKIIYSILSDISLNGDKHWLLDEYKLYKELNSIVKCLKDIRIGKKKNNAFSLQVDPNDQEFVYEQQDEDIIKEMQTKQEIM